MQRPSYIIQIKTKTKKAGYYAHAVRTHYYNNRKEALLALKGFPKGTKVFNRRTGKVLSCSSKN